MDMVILKKHPSISIKEATNLSVNRGMGANPVLIEYWFKDS